MRLGREYRYLNGKPLWFVKLQGIYVELVCKCLLGVLHLKWSATAECVECLCIVEMEDQISESLLQSNHYV